MRSDLLHYPFEGEHAQRTLIDMTVAYTLLLVFVPFLAEALEMGFVYQIVRAMLVDGQPPRLPEGGVRWRRYLADGLRWLYISYLFHLPSFLVFFASVGLVLWRYGGVEGPDGADWQGLSEGWPILVVGLSLAVPLNILGGWLSNIAFMHAVRCGTVWAAFRFRDWGALLRANMRGFVRAYINLILFGIALGIAQFGISLPAALLIVLPAVVAAFFSIYQRLVAAALYAETYQAAERVLHAGSVS